VNFTAPNLGVVLRDGSRDNNYVLSGRPLGAAMFRDPNPAEGPEALFKITAFAPHRGTVLYVSPDMRHWHRNESVLLPLMSGGDAEPFFDDQRGRYVVHLKRDAGSRGGASLLYRGRRAVLFQTAALYRPWPFTALAMPYFEGYPMPTITD